MKYPAGEHGTQQHAADRPSTSPAVTATVRRPKRAEPTEPEVPSAKRVHALHRQRATLVAAVAVACLFALVVVLLYKTGRQVTTLPRGATSAPRSANPEPLPSAPMPTTAVGNAAPAATPAPNAEPAAKENGFVGSPPTSSTSTRAGPAPRVKRSSPSSGSKK